MNSCLPDEGSLVLLNSHKRAMGAPGHFASPADSVHPDCRPSSAPGSSLTHPCANYSLIPSRLFIEGKFSVDLPHLHPSDCGLGHFQTLPLPGWFHQQPENREILIRWMDRICSQMRFSGQTLSLAVYLMDLLSRRMEEHGLETRLIALICLYLASKLYETQTNYLKAEAIYDFFGGKFSKEDIYRCERFAFAQLQFNLRRTTPYEALCSFLSKGFVTSEDLQQLDGHTSADEMVSRLELRALELHFRLLFETQTNRFQPTVVAAAVLSSVRAQLGLAPWSDLLSQYTGFRHCDIQDCLAIVLRFWNSEGASSDFRASSNTFTDEYRRQTSSVFLANASSPSETTSTMPRKDFHLSPSAADEQVVNRGSQYRNTNKICKGRWRKSRVSRGMQPAWSSLKPTAARNPKF